MSKNTFSESYTFLGNNNVFSLKPVASSRWWSRALLGKVNVEVNIKTYHVTCHVTSTLKVMILQYHFQIYYRQNKANAAIDTLSQLFQKSKNEEDKF